MWLEVVLLWLIMSWWGIRNFMFWRGMVHRFRSVMGLWRTMFWRCMICRFWSIVGFRGILWSWSIMGYGRMRRLVRCLRLMFNSMFHGCTIMRFRMIYWFWFRGFFITNMWFCWLFIGWLRFSGLFVGWFRFWWLFIAIRGSYMGFRRVRFWFFIGWFWMVRGV